MNEEYMKMSCGELISQVSKHMTTALMFHSQMCDYFTFLGLKGFKRLHQYQYFSESIAKKKLHNKYIKSYNKLIKDEGHDHIEVIPMEWYKHSRMDIDDAVLPRYVKNAWKMYMEWEEQTKQMYECICNVFLSKGMLTEYEMMKCFLMDVQEELAEIYKIQEEFNCVGYDVVYIMDMQCWLHERYKKKMSKLKA